MELKRIIYSSRKSPKLDLEDTIELITDAAVRNAVVGLTGFILYAPRFFLQLLEGESDVVDETFKRIEVDPRHSDIAILDESTVDERSFAQWSMGFASGDENRTRLLEEAGIDVDAEFPRLGSDEALELLTKLANG